MSLAQGRLWRATLGRDEDSVSVALQREGLTADLAEFRDFRIEIPLARWSGLLKHRVSDRKLFGGVLLDFAQPKDLVAAVVAHDRLLHELRGVLVEATLALIEAGRLALAPPVEPEA